MYPGPHIVTEGLILSLDASSPRSYPGSGTTWNNLGDNLYNATIQTQASISSKQGQHTDLFHADLAVTATDDVYNNTQLSYTHNNFG